MRQIHIFLVLSVPIVTYYILSYWGDPLGSKTVVAFVLMSVMSWLALREMRDYYRIPNGFAIDYDEDLDRRGLGLCALTTLAIFLVSIVFSGLLGGQQIAGKSGVELLVFLAMNAVLYVPQALRLGIFETATSVFNQLLNEAVWQTFIVSAGEELLKLSSIVGITFRFQKSASPFLRSHYRELGALIPISVWAFLHAMIAYSNVYMTLAAFIAGCLLFWLLLRVKSIVGVILSHSGYNTLIQAIKILFGSV